MTTTKPNPNAKDIHLIVNRLGSIFRTRRESAWLRLTEMPNDLVRLILLARLNRDIASNRTRKWHLWLFLSLVWLVPTMVTNWLAPSLPLHPSGANVAQFHIAWSLLDHCLFAWYSVLLAGGLMSRARHTRRQYRMWKVAAMLSGGDNAALVGPFTDLITQTNLATNQSKFNGSASAVTDAWLRLLPTITSETAGALDGRQRGQLRIMLSRIEQGEAVTHDDCRAAISILQYITATGDLNAFDLVRRIAIRRDRLGREQAIKAKAKDCLKALEAARKRAQTGAELLRASAAPAAHSEVLLRGTAPPVDARPAELLRPERVEAAPVAAPFKLIINQEAEKEEDQVVMGQVR